MRHRCSRYDALARPFVFSPHDTRTGHGAGGIAVRLASARLAEEMGSARKSSALRQYSRAASWAGLSAAKLGRAGEAHRLLEEALRYDSDSAGTWNVYASAMTVLEKHKQSVAAARNAVTIASRTAGDRIPDALDLNIYRYALASALSRVETDSRGSEAETLLGQIIVSLSDRQFDSLRRKIGTWPFLRIGSTILQRSLAWRGSLRATNGSAILRSRSTPARSRSRSSVNTRRFSVNGRK